MEQQQTSNEFFMRAALDEARKAIDCKEIPVGAVIVYEGNIIARAHNRRILDNDASAHAEVVALRQAGAALGRWNLTDCDMYVTLEPCAMCAGAIVNARINRLYFGAYDMRFGCCGTIMNIASHEMLNHRAIVEGGILQDECSTLLTDYFKAMRVRNNNPHSGQTGSKMKRTQICN